MLQSNIGITSNIYIRRHPDITKDREYTAKITGAKRIRALTARYTGLEAIPLNDVQRKIAAGNVTCAYAKSGEMSFGPVMANGSLQWVNRCEYTECSRYEECVGARVPHRIQREEAAEDPAEEQKNLQAFFESLGILIQDDDTVVFARDRNTAKAEENPKAYVAPAEQAAEVIRASGSRYTEITAPDCIITAPLDSHIILNSGPGTGKTYTIIQRLIYLLANDLCPAEEIYILCYTRSAKQVVETKLDQAVTAGIIRPSAKNICVLTFDSYATYFLTAMREQGVLREDFSTYDYNARIRLFNQYITAEDFAGIRYFIVDEIQDLVNERAEMVLKILNNLKCGYLLAGDRCQSIYDYEADDDATLDSVEFYAQAEQQFPPDMQRYEITVNRRQTPALARAAEQMRRVLLSESFLNQNKYAAGVIAECAGKIKIESYIKSLTGAPDVPTAILCRSNGEAEYISGLLCERGIPHMLNRGVNNTAPLPRWIADVFWDCCRAAVSKKDFTERFRFRCAGSPLDPEKLWAQLCRMTGTQEQAVLETEKLTAALSAANNIPADFYPAAPLLTVSTIHKAKGSEFDSVILIESEVRLSAVSAEEARIRYVALTRPKTQFITMKKSTKYFKRTLSGRVIETGLHHMYKTRNKFCKCITVGLNGDIDSNAFVSGNFDSILDQQEYITREVHLYDKLSAKRSAVSGRYEIYHNGHCIGALSGGMTDEIEMGVGSTDYRYNLPDSLENLYVSGITSEVLRQFSEDVPLEYRRSRICFGIQITGLAKLVFEKK